MNEIEILVCGSVTAKQYEPIRFEALREGHKPIIERWESQSMSDIVENFIDDTLDIDSLEPGELTDMVGSFFAGRSLVVVVDEETHLGSRGWNIHHILVDANVEHDYWIIMPDGKAEFCG